MNVVDSSGWLEYLANGANADFFAPPIKDESVLLVPTICLYEVFKRLYQWRGEEAALQAVSRLYRGTVVAVSDEIALLGAQLSLVHRLSLADSLIYATARLHNATLWTQDEHFEGLEGVKYIQRK